MDLKWAADRLRVRHRNRVGGGFVFLLLPLGLTGCGGPTSDGPLAEQASRGVHAVGVSPVTDTSLAGTGRESKSIPGSLASEEFVEVTPSQGRNDEITKIPANLGPPQDPLQADQVRREARESWYAEVRTQADATVRLQALEVWDQQPGDTLDLVTYALVDEEEQVRTRAQELWSLQLARDLAVAPPSQDSTFVHRAER